HLDGADALLLVVTLEVGELDLRVVVLAEVGHAQVGVGVWVHEEKALRLAHELKHDFGPRREPQLLGAELAVAVAVEIIKPLFDVAVPRLVDGLTIDVDVELKQNGALVGEKDKLAAFGEGGASGGLEDALSQGARSGRGQPHDGEAAQNRENAECHAMISETARAPFSTMRIGRPTLDIFCFVGSIPRARQMVAMKSGTLVGRSASTVVPSALVRPTTRPPRRPPPARTVVQALG